LSAAAQNPPAPAPAQNAPAPKETVHDGYLVHQSIDIGGRISNQNGSLPMYGTLVNMHTGPRILTQSIEMHAVPDAKHFFLYDSLLATSEGYGGDPENSTVLRMSKGKTYDFQGMFRRDREYFDYDLLGNPLIPPGRDLKWLHLSAGAPGRAPVQYSAADDGHGPDLVPGFEGQLPVGVLAKHQPGA